MDELEKVFIQQAIEQRNIVFDHEWRRQLMERKYILDSQFIFTPDNIKKIEIVNNWLKEVEHKTLNFSKSLSIECLQNRKIDDSAFLTDYELEYELHLWADNKYREIEELIGNPFFSCRMTLPNYKTERDEKLKQNPYNPDAEHWVLNVNHNAFAHAENHPLRDQSHCWTLHELYDHTYLSWQDIIETESIWFEIDLKLQHMTFSPISK